MKTNPIQLEIFKNRFISIAEEMGVTLTRTAYSPNIKERRDCSCALFDSRGDMIAQAAHIPVHLGSMPLSVQAAIAEADLQEGDMIALNDPYRGGTHLPDITVVAPVFTGTDEPAFYVANRAHHADVGGMCSGSMPLSTSLFQEGLIIPPVKLVQGGILNRDIMNLILGNVRTPAEREGDFAAQIMANLTGIKQLKRLCETFGIDTVREYGEHLISYAERLTRNSIAAIPDGCYEFGDVLEDDGKGESNITIDVAVTIQGDAAYIDLSKSSPQTTGCVNAVRAITISAVLYVFRCLTGEDVPTNAGCLKPVTITTRPGTIVDAAFPAAVAGGNVETSQRIVDVLLGALAQALPGRIPAASQGTMNNVAIGGIDHRNAKPFAYYETIAGGMGASAEGPGEHAVHSHMTNTLNTPAEALEYSCPLRVTQYSLRGESGGDGSFKGGNGIIREIEFLSDAEVTVISERRTRGPYGLSGGSAGKKGANTVIMNRASTLMPSKFQTVLRQGDRLRIETPGGGGYGKKTE